MKESRFKKYNNEIGNLSNYLTIFSEDLSNEIDFFREQISNNLDFICAYNRYVGKNEKYIEDNPEKIEEFFEFAYYQYHSHFPYIINSSLLITLDSYFENKFYLLTKVISLKTQNSFNIKDKNGSNISKYFKHLKDSLKIEIPKNNDNWISIEKNHQIRNLIVHNNSSLLGNLSDVADISELKKHKDYNTISNCEYIEFNELTGRFYIMDKNFLLNYLIDITNFFKTIVEKVELDNV